MSRWFRHYAGMMRDDKLVSVASFARQDIATTCWVWGAILESAADIDEFGRYEIDAGEIAYFLHAEEEAIHAILLAFDELEITGGDKVLDWRRYSRHSARLPYSDWVIIRAGVFERDNYTCRYCGEHGVKLECDHVVPVSRGGTNAVANLVTACQSCNRTKRDRTPEEMGWTA